MMKTFLTGAICAILGAILGAGNVWHRIDDQINTQNGRLVTPDDQYECITLAELEWMQPEHK